jgi:hypothetical protein
MVPWSVNKSDVLKSKKPSTLESMVLAGGTALVCVNFTHPLDLYKTRLQAGNMNLAKLIRDEGLLSLWKGISPAYFREGTYTSIKLGCYGPIKRLLGCDGPDATFLPKFLSGSLSGGLGTIVGNPFDVLKTKGMTNKGANISMIGTINEMYSNQGITGFYRGFTANVSRACVLNGTKMSCYDQIKGMVIEYTNWERKDLRCQTLSAFGAGFFMSCTTAPFDMVRTTLMNQPTDRVIYKGFKDAAMTVFKEQGILGFYKGFLPMWGRFAPQATLQLVIYDNLLHLYGFETI